MKKQLQKKILVNLHWRNKFNNAICVKSDLSNLCWKTDNNVHALSTVKLGNKKTSFNFLLSSHVFITVITIYYNFGCLLNSTNEITVHHHSCLERLLAGISKRPVTQYHTWCVSDSKQHIQLYGGAGKGAYRYVRVRIRE